jgi:hypothetical protein
MLLKFGKPNKRVLCGPHATKEKSVVPPRRCRVLLHTPRKLGNECLLEEVVDDGLDDDDPFFFGEKTCSFLP